MLLFCCCFWFFYHLFIYLFIYCGYIFVAFFTNSLDTSF